MSRKQRVSYSLNHGNITSLSQNEIKAILRAADELIATGGRTMLVKVLKGSKDKKVLEHGLQDCPAYGFYASLTMEEIGYRVDWTIQADYLRIEYSDRLPTLVFSEKGWEIEKETFAQELYERFLQENRENKGEILLELREINRQVVFAVLEKIRRGKHIELLPMLEAWKEIEVRKVRERISSVERSLKEPQRELQKEPELVCRRARKGEGKEIARLIKKTVETVYPHYYPEDVAMFFCLYHTRERIEQAVLKKEVWVLTCGERIIGTGSAEENQITRFYVLPELQRKGYGNRLLKALESEIFKTYDRVVSEVSLPSVFLYEKRGYSTVTHKQMALINDIVLVYEVMEKKR